MRRGFKKGAHSEEPKNFNNVPFSDILGSSLHIQGDILNVTDSLQYKLQVLQSVRGPSQVYS